MSVVTFLIGNGFDLACELKSSYKDTYKGYCEPSSEANKSEAIKFLKENIGKDIDKWADFEMAIAKYAEQNLNTQNLKKDSELRECITDYKNYLRRYLKNEQDAFHESCREDENKRRKFVKATRHFLLEFFEELTPNDKNVISPILKTGGNQELHFISFNYTNIFDELKKEALLNSKKNDANQFLRIDNSVLHIHGTINNNNDENEIILGVDNESQLHLPYKLNYRVERALVKPSFIKAYDESRMIAAKSYIQSSDVICAFGLTLGESDFTWRKAVADWLLENPTHHFVFCDYDFGKENYYDVSYKKDAEEQRKHTLIFIFFDKQIPYQQVFQQIHVVTTQSVFKIIEENYFTPHYPIYH